MEKTDLVYILRPSAWRDNEIRYSLRSVQKNMDCAGRVFIVGHRPRFISDQVTHIPAEDPYNNKLRNAVHKIRIACADPRVSEKFVLMNDDFFFLKRHEEIPFYNRGRLTVMIKKHETRAGYYFKALRTTCEMLENMGVKDPKDFEVHCPIVLDKTNFLRITGEIGNDDGYVFRSAYANLMGMKGKYRRDVKNRSNFKVEDISRLDILSTDDKVVLTARFQKFIRRRFPERSKYEKEMFQQYYARETFGYGGRIYNPGDIITVKLPEQIIKANKLEPAPFFE